LYVKGFKDRTFIFNDKKGLFIDNLTNISYQKLDMYM